MAVMGSEVTKQANKATRNAGNETDNLVLFDDELRGFIQQKGGIQGIGVQIQGQESSQLDQNNSDEEILDPYDDDYQLKKIEQMEKELDEIQTRNREKNSMLSRKEIKKRAKQERQIKEIIDEGIVLRKQDVEQLQQQRKSGISKEANQSSNEQSDENQSQQEVQDRNDNGQESSQEELDQADGQELDSDDQELDSEDQESDQDQVIDQDEKSDDQQESDKDNDSKILENSKIQQATNLEVKKPKASLLNMTKQWFNQQFFDGDDQNLFKEDQESCMQKSSSKDYKISKTTKDILIDADHNDNDDIRFKGLVKMPQIKSQRQIRKEKLRKYRQRQAKKLQKAQKLLPGTGGTLSQFLQQPDTKIQQVPIVQNEQLDVQQQQSNLGDQYDSDDIAQTLVIAQKMLRKKDRRQIIQSSYNRYCFAADQRKNLPDWFNQDQFRNFRPNLPVTKQEIAAQKQALKQYNARPIKKVAQAKIRKKKRLEKAMQKAKAKAVQISNQSQISEASKAKQIQSIYRKTRARVENKKEKKYSISKRGGAKSAQKMGQKLKANMVKGKKVKMVDKRMKKDKRADKIRNGKLRKKKRTH